MATPELARDVHPVTAVQTEYSLWIRDVEAEVLPTCREFDIGFVPYSPLGRGFLTGSFDAGSDFPEGDFRASLPRFSDANLATNRSIVDVVRVIAAKKACTPAQITLAWLLAQGKDIVPIPGTKRVRYLEENVAASDIALSEDEILEFETVVEALPVAGARYTEEGMKGLNA